MFTRPSTLGITQNLEDSLIDNQIFCLIPYIWKLLLQKLLVVILEIWDNNLT